MKWFKPVYIVYVIILLIFIVYAISAIIQFPELHSRNENEYNMTSILRTLSYYSLFKPLLYLLIPVFAVLYKSKLSWFLLLSSFYLLTCNIFAVSLFDMTYEVMTFDVVYILTIIAVLILPIISIYILNRQNTYKNFYGIEKKSLLIFNIVAFILGCGTSILLLIKRYNLYYNTF